MDEFITHYILSYGGAAGLCLVLVLLGLLVPKRYHDREIEAKDREIAAEQEKNRKLTEAIGRLQATVDIDRVTIERLSSSGQLTNQVVGALITIAGDGRQAAGGPPPAPPQQALTAGGQ